MCVRARVSRWMGFLDISVVGVRLKRLHYFHIKAKPGKHTIHILHRARYIVARSVACKLRKQVLRSILAPGTFFPGK